MIVVTGATGKLGHLIANRLISKVSADRVGISVRDPAKATSLRLQGVRVRRGDFTQPDSLPHAFEGASQLMLVSSNAGPMGGDPLAQHREAIKAAKEAGVRRIVYTSHVGAAVPQAPQLVRMHALTEAMLAESGLAWTALRNGYYADSAFRFMGPDWKRGPIVAPADGKVAWTGHGDLADGAVAVLTGHETFDGPTPPLTGPESLDLADLARIASHFLNRQIDRQTSDDDDHRRSLMTRGLPENIARLTLDFFVASRRGDFEAVDPTLAKLIGRNPTSMQQILSEAISGD